MEIQNVQELKQLGHLLKGNDISTTEKEMYFVMGQNDKIRAIKLRRELTGHDLGESKVWVEKQMEKLTRTF